MPIYRRESGRAPHYCGAHGRAYGMTSFWGGLKRRNVVKVAISYGVDSWLLLEIESIPGMEHCLIAL